MPHRAPQSTWHSPHGQHGHASRHAASGLWLSVRMPICDSRTQTEDAVRHPFTSFPRAGKTAATQRKAPGQKTQTEKLKGKTFWSDSGGSNSFATGAFFQAPEVNASEGNALPRQAFLLLLSAVLLG